MSTPIVLPPLAGALEELWDVLFHLAEHVTAPWTLVGGQMVLLHALEHDQVPPQISQDGDLVGDLRASPEVLRELVAALGAVDFELDGASPDGLAHRYVRVSDAGLVRIDVLAPEGAGSRADLTTTPPGRTVQVPGGTQALRRSEWVSVVHRGRERRISRPSLVAAIVTKAAACGLPGDPARHLRDLALLLALLEDPFAAIAQLTAKERQRLRRVKALEDDAHMAWLLVPEELRDGGRAAFEILRSDPTP